MGASHATLSSTATAEDNDATLQLPGYTVDQRLYPGSGRMMRTYRLKHLHSEALVVTKTMYISQDYSQDIKQHEQELFKIKEALKGQAHVAPFVYWHVGDFVHKQQTRFRPVFLVRPHVYTTLSDRLACRPFLNFCEKLWIVHQLLDALQQMHTAGVCHGFLTTENVGLTSWNHLVLLDISSYKAMTALPDDDPSLYLQYFQETNKHGNDSTARREKRCYLAPERFYTPSSSETPSPPTTPSSPLTPAMDIFSAGCVIIETVLNGERALDLGDLMEYRCGKGTTVQQKLNKIESSSLRAACRHMLHVLPESRLSAQEYRDLLKDVMPSTFETMFVPLWKRITTEEVTPDARMAVAASYYAQVLKATVGIRDAQGGAYFEKILGPTMVKLETVGEPETKEWTTSAALTDIGNRIMSEQDVLLAETEELLKKLESPSFDNEDDAFSIMPPRKVTMANGDDDELPQPSPEDASSLLVYLQLILSTVRSVQRPSSKLVGLQLLDRLGAFSSDDSKLQRIVPVTVSFLHDQDPLVRASAVQVMTSTLSTIKTFAPSDSNIFPQYIFKRVAHLSNDASLVVRVAFAQCIASLADTAHRFLDISHAVRLYEAVGGGNGPDGTDKGDGCLAPDVFSDDVAKLLDGSKQETKSSESDIETTSRTPGHSRMSSIGASESASTIGRTLISSTYTSELAALREIVSRWVVHIATDQSDQSSPPKRSLLCDIARLCNFFSRDGAMAFILPQILAFLNDRRDWQLRAALFERLPSVCSIIGRAATEHFVLPCLETALVDAEDIVMSRALLCLSSLVELGLLSRSVLVTPQSVLPTTGLPGNMRRGLFEKYLPLLVYPSSNIRHCAIVYVNASCRSLGFPDVFVFLLPHLRPYLRFEPTIAHLTSEDGLERCLIPPWSREKLNEEIDRLAALSAEGQTRDQWTSLDNVADEAQRPDATPVVLPSSIVGSEQESELRGDQEMINDCIVEYLTMLQRSRGASSSGYDRLNEGGSEISIEGSLKLAQHVKFPHQRVAGTDEVSIPSWYTSLHESSDGDRQFFETSAIRSVSTLSQVYGLSVIEDPTQLTSRVAKDAVIVGHKASAVSARDEPTQLDLDRESDLHSTDAKLLQGANAGEWGSDVRLDPTIADTAVLVTKMQGLEVPPLPPNFGMIQKQDMPSALRERRPAGDAKAQTSGDWRPRADALIASSSFVNGHTAPVSRLAVAPDQRYFVSASYDGTLRVWETRQAKESDGVLMSSATYTGHLDGSEHGHPRINDVASLENSHSVISGASDGSLHVWRVDMVSKSLSTTAGSQNITSKIEFDRSRVAGYSTIRKMNPNEGEIHAVSHFNTPSSSVVLFATQGAVHSMDLRQSRVPFVLKHEPSRGYLTSMALGSDSHWMITGTSRGCVALWDIRFQQKVKLWRHSSESPVTRLATSFASLPKKWGDRGNATIERKPFMFVACGSNECGMFDVSGSARDCFRVVGPRSRSTDAMDLKTKMPILREIGLSSTRSSFRHGDFLHNTSRVGSSGPSINALVGNIGGSDHSYMFTGGDDGFIRYWDFSTPSKCFTVSGYHGFHQRPTYERVDFDGQRLILCRQAPSMTRTSEIESSRFPRTVEKGNPNHHTDSITDLKLINSPERLMVSCSCDSSLKLWR